MSVPADGERQGEQAGDLHQHGSVADALLLHLTSSGRCGHRRRGTRRRRAASPAGRRASACRRAGGVARATTQTRSSVKTGWVRPGKSKPSGTMIRSRRISWVSNWSREAGRCRSATEQPGACSASSRVSGSASTVMAYSDMLTSNCLVLDVGSNSRWLPSSASAASTRLGDQRPQLLSKRCELEAAAAADQQLVVEVLAQSGQRAAHRRLAHGHPLAGVGEVALFEQGVQRRAAGWRRPRASPRSPFLLATASRWVSDRMV